MTPIDPAILAKFVETFRSPPDEELTFVDKVARGHLRMGFADGYQLCAAEKQAEIDLLKEEVSRQIAELSEWRLEHARAESRLMELEQQRLQDREDTERYRYFKQVISVPYATQSFLKFMNWNPRTFDAGIDEAIDAARAKEPHHD